MARQRFQRGARRRTPNRDWAGFNNSTYTSIAAATSAIVGSFTLINPGIDETVLRTVGVLSIASDQAAANEVQIGAFGMIKVSDAAFAAGIASIPTPITEIADDGWLLYVPFSQQGDQSLTQPPSREYHFDSKAKRIIEDGTTLAVVIQNAGGTGLQFAVVMRLLSMVRGTGG